MQVNEKFISQLLRDSSRSIVGKLCKQNEILQSRNDLSANQKLDILKNFNKELIYEHFRDLNNQIKNHALGMDYKKFNVTSSPNQS